MRRGGRESIKVSRIPRRSFGAEGLTNKVQYCYRVRVGETSDLE